MSQTPDSVEVHLPLTQLTTRESECEATLQLSGWGDDHIYGPLGRRVRQDRSSTNRPVCQLRTRNISEEAIRCLPQPAAT